MPEHGGLCVPCLSMGDCACRAPSPHGGVGSCWAQAIKLGWTYLKREDAVSKSHAFLNVSYFLRSYTPTEKMVLQVSRPLATPQAHRPSALPRPHHHPHNPCHPLPTPSPLRQQQADCLPSLPDDSSVAAQVFVALLRAHQADAKKALIRESMDVLVPTLDAKLARPPDSRVSMWIKYTKKVTAMLLNVMA
jgi:hypothetical protein